MRTVLAIDRESRSMTFAGDVPQGWTAQLIAEIWIDWPPARQMRRDKRALACAPGMVINVFLDFGELHWAAATYGTKDRSGSRGRRCRARARKTPRLGFYSYGEISPHAKSGHCELHNQTMTVTTFAEVG